MEHRFLNEIEAPCGCAAAFDTLYWRPRPLRHCAHHIQMMVMMSLGTMPIFSFEEDFHA